MFEIRVLIRKTITNKSGSYYYDEVLNCFNKYVINLSLVACFFRSPVIKPLPVLNPNLPSVTSF